jgi:hypothetical protein
MIKKYLKFCEMRLFLYVRMKMIEKKGYNSDEVKSNTGLITESVYIPFFFELFV